MIVYTLIEVVDLGYHVHGIYLDGTEAERIAAENNVRDKISWTGADGLIRYSEDKWDVEEHDVIGS